MTTAQRVDFSYLKKYGKRTVYNLPTMFEMYPMEEGQSFGARISNIYDPSKFWMVLKYKELEAFQKYLFKFYYMKSADYKIPNGKLRPDMYCVAFSDQGYYRCVVLDVTTLQDSALPRAYVHYVDFGMFGMVDCKDLYYMCEKIVRVPQFAVRGAIAGICPTSPDDQWTAQDVFRFSTLVCNKNLYGSVVAVDVDRQVLCVQIRVVGNSVPVHRQLIREKIARFITEELKSDLGHNFPHVFPSHKMLESGAVPTSVDDLDHQAILSIGSYFKTILNQQHTMGP